MLKAVLILLAMLGAAVSGWGAIYYFVDLKKPKIKEMTANESEYNKSTPIKQKYKSSGQKAPNIGAPEKNLSGFDPETSFEDGELVVVDPPPEFASEIRQLGFTILENISLGSLEMNVVRLRIPADQTVSSARRQLLGRFPGLLIDVNHQFDLSEQEQPINGRTTRTSNINKKSLAQAAIGWNVPASCGEGVKLGMIDSGVDVDHPALRGQKVEFRSFHNPQRRPGPKEHGTAVATMLVGKPGARGWGGLLPSAELKAANMFELNKIGRKVGTVMALLKGLNWLARENVHVVNLSIAGANNRTLNRAFRTARKKGMIMVAAVGNWGRSDKPAYPAAYTGVIAVTAVDPFRRRTIYKMANRGEYVEFAAPGVRIWTAVPGGGKFQSGTSFATPYLVALMGLEIARGARKNVDSIRRMMKKNIADLGSPGKDNTYGWGFIEKRPVC